jgi:GGDEF domain-containing protein
LHLAELIAGLAVDTRPSALSELLEAGEKYRGLTLDQLKEILQTLEEKVSQLASVLSLDLPEGKSCLEVLAQAQARLSVAVEDAAARLSREEQVAEELLRDARSLQESLAQAARHTRAPAAPSNYAPSGHATRGESPRDTGVYSPGRAGVLTAADPGLAGRVLAGVATCRAARASFSLLMLGLDRYDELILKLGTQGASKVGGLVEAAVRAACDQADVLLPLGDGNYCVLLERRDRPRAATLGRDVMKGFARRVSRHLLPGAATVSAGAATLALPPKNFSAFELIDAAQRCLSAAQHSGGDSLKSIDL